MKKRILPVLAMILAVLCLFGGVSAFAVEAEETVLSAQEEQLPETRLQIWRDEDVTVEQETSELNLVSGEAIQIIARSNEIDVNSIVSWTSSDETIVTVEDGKVTAVGYGACYITAKLGIVEAEWSVVVTPAQVVLNEPVRVSPGRVALKWDKVSEITGYQLYRSCDEQGIYSKIKTISADELSRYTNTVVRNNRYFYKIRAYYKTEDGTYIYGAWSDIRDIEM